MQLVTQTNHKTHKVYLGMAITTNIPPHYFLPPSQEHSHHLTLFPNHVKVDQQVMTITTHMQCSLD